MKKFLLMVLVLVPLFGCKPKGVVDIPPAPKATFIVTFASGGVSVNGDMEEQIFTEGEMQPLALCGFTLDGYKFIGWSLSEGGAKAYDDGQEVLIDNDVTLYALWELYPFVKISKGTYNLNKDGSLKVTLTSDFEIAIHEVTQNEFASLMKYNPSHFSSDPWGVEIQGSRPVEYLTWYEAIAYCNKLSEAKGIKGASSNIVDFVYFSDADCSAVYNSEDAASKKEVHIKLDSEGKIDAVGYRLPTEAEWEAAARGGREGDVFASPDEDLGSYGWWGGNGKSKTHQVMLLKPNGYGLYDMSGNVWEWCYDWWAAYESPAADPKGPSDGTNKVARGGSYGNSSNSFLRVSYRNQYKPESTVSSLGFRVCRSVK